MTEYNMVKIAGDFNQTDTALGQAIQTIPNNICFMSIIVIIAIFCWTLVKIFKITNSKSVEYNFYKKRKGK
ncbi:hypothetical protein L8W41_07125 [Campylobacter sp. IFREMER_LSEM_CL1904]|uniref:hypothetical protein n=1 Tax=Campylobacter sp. IFREMER_LSEM_CL1904 TaxID=2911616 RepID=UPI0021E68A6A|nr:hypothetical protein [Campylobacter sp. IFREMER_LSEM_CL1904]MCV3428498.1 hypothetical protein [Campylobacter sp. IFREMER_LSEM_CL1904]HDV6577746.1 hypothetical protein [Campylobacter lari]